MNAESFETLRTAAGTPFAMLDAARPSASHAASHAADVVPAAARPVVREMGTADAGRWDAFVRSAPDATFFHRAAWRDVIETVFGHRTLFLYAERAGRVEQRARSRLVVRDDAAAAAADDVVREAVARVLGP